uniref:Saposin B-type domain-containing protein n=1 Tax=Steinernema glaseri TaxID=37863 RepID=A0A1I8ACX6_9BILA
MLPFLTSTVLLLAVATDGGSSGYARKNNLFDNDDVDGTIEGPMLTLSCTLCEQFFNITLRMRRNSSSKKQIERFVRSEHCGGIGVFKNICGETVDTYFAAIYAAVEKAEEKANVTTTCQDIGLCSGKKIPAYCKTYYDQGGPLLPDKYLGDYEL